MATDGKTFYGYFKANMESMGLTAPNSLFGTMEQARRTIAEIAGLIKTFGTRVTVGELIGAGTALEALGVLGAVSASYYVGACIGSCIVALNKVTSDKLGVAHFFAFAEQQKMNVDPDVLTQIYFEYSRGRGRMAEGTAIA
ncbi:MAG: hypothetical protein KA230_06180 [Flavobacteriales bacterium]|nr:hypothetical protein [Flavobacteriales bacterium]